MMNNYKDYRTLLFLLASLIYFTFLYSLSFDQLNLPKWIFLIFIGILGIFIICLINHNHRHRPIFKNIFLNRLTNILITLLIGAPSTRLHLVHHYNHHKYYPTLSDWSHFQSNAHGRGLNRIFNYLSNASKKMNRNRSILVDTKLKKQMLLEERIFLYGLIFFFLIKNPLVFFLIIMPIWFGALALLLTSNLLNHDFCHIDTSVNNSRDFISKIENWFFFNNGYHTAHHLHPAKDWTELPHTHKKEVAPFKEEKFISKSFFIFLFEYILWTSSIQRMEEEHLKLQYSQKN